MSRHSSLRASDADREHIADRLRKAMAEGRLTSDELEHRIGAAFSARTYGELGGLISDLPGERPAHRRSVLSMWSLSPLQALVALVFLLPLVLLAIAMVVFVLTGLAAAWGMWMLATWWILGHRRRMPMGGFGRRMHSDRSSRLDAASAHRHTRAGFWA